MQATRTKSGQSMWLWVLLVEISALMLAILCACTTFIVIAIQTYNANTQSGMPAPAFNDERDHLSILSIKVLPEYDRPSVLVIVEGFVEDKTNLPREVKVLIPSDAQLYVTTYANPDGWLAPEQPATLTDLGDGYTCVTFTIAQPIYHVEYYHALLTGAPDRSMTFRYRLSAATDQANLLIQQPARSINFGVLPTPQDLRYDPAGYKYAVLLYEGMGAGEEIGAQVRYSKWDNKPSLEE